MAQSTLHFSLGMILGTLVALPSVYRAWTQTRPVARCVARWCLLSYALGLYAVLPAIIRRVAGDPALGSGPWWNLFLFYPLLDRLPLPSIVGGELVATALFTLQYSVIVLAIRRAMTRGSGQDDAGVSLFGYLRGCLKTRLGRKKAKD